MNVIMHLPRVDRQKHRISLPWYAAPYTPFGSGLPSTPAIKFSAAISAICSRVAIEALPICGSTTQFGSENKRMIYRQRLGRGNVQTPPRQSARACSAW